MAVTLCFSCKSSLKSALWSFILFHSCFHRLHNLLFTVESDSCDCVSWWSYKDLSVISAQWLINENKQTKTHTNQLRESDWVLERCLFWRTWIPSAVEMTVVLQATAVAWLLLQSRLYWGSDDNSCFHHNRLWLQFKRLKVRGNAGK